MSHHVVAAKALTFGYPDGRLVLQGISFHIEHGESVAIVGPNGAGKSTLLKHLNGTLLPEGGKVVVGDFSVTKKSVREVRRAVGMVFQDPDDQLFMPRVLDDVAFGPLNLGMEPSEVQSWVDEVLGKVGCLHLKERLSHQLSGGEKRLVSIATALSMSPDILVMDEPTAALDPRARRNLIQLLKTFEHTKIIATHDLDLALESCERAIVLCDGRKCYDGPTEELFSRKSDLEKWGLELPLQLQRCQTCSVANSSN